MRTAGIGAPPSRARRVRAALASAVALMLLAPAHARAGEPEPPADRSILADDHDASESEPADLEPATVEPATVEPADIEAAGVEPPGVEPTAVEPPGAEPVSSEPASVEPASVEPASIEPTAVEPTTIEPATRGPSEPPVVTATEDPDAARRRSWISCTAGTTACVRSRPARALLLSLGVAGGALASGLLFGLGDRIAPGDPATLLVGISGLAGAGALAGMLAGRLGPDGPAAPDRLRPPTLSLAYDYSGPQILDETRPHSLSVRVAPNLYLPNGHGRARLFGHVGGWLNPARDVDPRPQLAESLPEQQGTAPRVLQQRHVSIGVGIDLAVNLPYPVLAPKRSARLGAAELRYRPEVQIRRDHFDPNTPESTVLERTMLLPLTTGVRWHLSPRQRFTVYFGPRFDFVAFSDPTTDGSSDRLHRGGPQRGLLYGEAWYDIDVPLTARSRRDGKVRSLQATGQLTLGYVHSGFDGQGFDFGPVVGFLGPLHVAWSTRLRPVGSAMAAQLGAFARIGSGTTMGLEVGIVAPDLHARGRASR